MASWVCEEVGVRNADGDGQCPSSLKPASMLPVRVSHVSRGGRQEEGFHSACPRLCIARSATAAKRGRGGHDDMIEAVPCRVFSTPRLLVGPGTHVFLEPTRRLCPRELPTPPPSFCLGVVCQLWEVDVHCMKCVSYELGATHSKCFTQFEKLELFAPP